MERGNEIGLTDHSQREQGYEIGSQLEIKKELKAWKVNTDKDEEDENEEEEKEEKKEEEEEEEEEISQSISAFILFKILGYLHVCSNYSIKE